MSEFTTGNDFLCLNCWIIPCILKQHQLLFLIVLKMILSSTPWRCCSQWLALMGSMIFALWLGKQCSAIAFFSSLLYPSYPNWFKLHPKHVSINYWWSMGNFLVSKFLKPFRRVLFQRCHGSLILYIDENIKGICLISFKAKQNWNWNTNI